MWEAGKLEYVQLGLKIPLAFPPPFQLQYLLPSQRWVNLIEAAM